MSTDDGLEYGPTPAGAQHEHTDIDPSIGYTFAVWLAVAMMVSAGILYGAFWYFRTSEVVRDTRVQQFPLAAGQVKDRPAPLLQTQPFKDVYLLKQGQNERLDSYGWVDKADGIVHIPIDRAIELTLERGLPARAGGSDATSMVVQDSSAGRTAAPR
jgi:hypothetical protein